MDNAILQLLSQLLAANGQSSSHSAAQQNPQMQNSYPPEAFNSTPQQANTSQISPLLSLLGGQMGNADNSLGILSSLLSKGQNPLSSILSGNKKEEEKTSSFPKNDLLL